MRDKVQTESPHFLSSMLLKLKLTSRYTHISSTVPDFPSHSLSLLLTFFFSSISQYSSTRPKMNKFQGPGAIQWSASLMSTEKQKNLMQGVRRGHCDHKSLIKDHRLLFNPKPQDLNAKIFADYTEHKQKMHRYMRTHRTLLLNKNYTTTQLSHT